MIIFTLVVMGLIFGSFINALVWRLRQQDLKQNEMKSASVKNPSQAKKPEKKIEGRRLNVASIIDYLSSPWLNPYKTSVILNVNEGSTQVGKKTLQPARYSTKIDDLSILHGRSMCPNCKHTLSALDLAPVFSWLFLRGKCRYCHKPISWQYPLVEIVTAALFVLSYLLWPVDVSGVGIAVFVVWLAIVVVFVAHTIYDMRWRELPDQLNAALVGLAVTFVGIKIAMNEDLGGFFEPILAAAVLFGLFFLIYKVSGGGWIGGGDVKLAPALGLIAGSPLKVFLLLFLASSLGLIASIPALISAKEKTKLQIPFGPFLITAAILVVLFGDKIIALYESVLI